MKQKIHSIMKIFLFPASRIILVDLLLIVEDTNSLQ